MMDNMITLLTYFCMLSVAAERAVEIMKLGVLKKYNPPAVTYQILAGLLGAVMSYYSPPPSTFVQMEQWITIIATGLAVSGGSSFWNSTLDAAISVSKNLKSPPEAPKVVTPQ